MWQAARGTELPDAKCRGRLAPAQCGACDPSLVRGMSPEAFVLKVPRRHAKGEC